jgi:hypothetical protein
MNLLIVGAAKAGTSSLFVYLSRHPAIGASRIKEPYCFYPETGQARVGSIREYLSLFPRGHGIQYLLEASAGYFSGGRAIALRIREALGPARVVVSLRDPVERALSAYKYERSRGLIDHDLTLDAYVDRCAQPALLRADKPLGKFTGISGGLYGPRLEEWFDVFPDTLRVVMFDDLCARPAWLVDELTSWLGLDVVPPGQTWERHNVSMAHRSRALGKAAESINRFAEPLLRSHPRVKRALKSAYLRLNSRSMDAVISDEARAKLEQHFREANDRAAALLERRGYGELPSWLWAPSPGCDESRHGASAVGAGFDRAGGRSED